jgi:hypothetical protein
MAGTPVVLYRSKSLIVHLSLFITSFTNLSFGLRLRCVIGDQVWLFFTID